MRLLVCLFCWTFRGLSSRHSGKHDGQSPHEEPRHEYSQINKQVYCNIRRHKQKRSVLSWRHSRDSFLEDE